MANGDYWQKVCSWRVECSLILISGPYFKFRTFQDYYDVSYSKYTDCTKAVLLRIRPVPLYIALFLLSSYIWPLEV